MFYIVKYLRLGVYDRLVLTQVAQALKVVKSKPKITI